MKNAFISYHTKAVMSSTTQFSSELRGQYKTKAYALCKHELLIELFYLLLVSLFL